MTIARKSLNSESGPTTGLQTILIKGLVGRSTTTDWPTDSLMFTRGRERPVSFIHLAPNQEVQMGLTYSAAGTGLRAGCLGVQEAS